MDFTCVIVKKFDCREMNTYIFHNPRFGFLTLEKVTQYDLHIKKADRYGAFIINILTGNPKSPFKGP